MKLTVSPDSIMCIYFFVSLLFSALIPWLRIDLSIMPVIVFWYHAIYWTAFSIYINLYLRQN